MYSLIAPTKIDLIWEWMKKNDGRIVAAILLVIIICQAKCTSDHKTEIALRKKEIKQDKKEMDSLNALNHEKDIAIAQSEKKVEKRDLEIFKLKLSFQQLKIKGDKEIAKVKNYNLKQWETYYRDIAKCPDDQIKATDSTLNFKREPLVTIANEIITGQVAKAQQKITLEQLAKSQDNEKDLKTIITYQDDVNKNKDIQIQIANNISKKWEDNFNDSQKDLKKAQRPKLVPIGIGVAAGIITGILIAK